MIKDKVAVVTGGSRGIGAAIAQKLASCGVHIAVLDIGCPEAVRQIVDQCRDYGVKVGSWQTDVADNDAVKEAVAAIREEFGTIDILVNNAGITRDGLIVRMKAEDFNAVLDVNLCGAFNTIRHIAPIMMRNRWGRIVNISSIAGIIGNAGQANYAASKAGLIGLTKSVARELAGRNITCNAVAPGFIQTAMTQGFDECAGLPATIPLGHMGKPEDVASAVAFLVEAEYITGEVLRVDGGLAI